MGTGPVPSISSLMSGALFSWREPGVRPVSRLFGVTEAWVQRLGTSAHPPSCGEAAPGWFLHSLWTKATLLVSVETACECPPFPPATAHPRL